MKELKIAAGNTSLINLFSKIEHFKDFTDQELRFFVDSGRLREYEPAEVIITEGDFDCWVYFLINGILEVKKGGGLVTTLRRCGDMFGEMGVIDGSPRSATILAQTKSLLIGFDASVIDQMLKKRQANFCYLIYRIFAEVMAVRLRETTSLNSKLKKEIAELKKHVEVQKAKAPAPVSPKPSPSANPPSQFLAKKKILIVDGVEATRNILRFLLRDLKAEKVLVAVDGESALRTLRENRVDLIISEYHLPRTSGVDLLQDVRSNPDFGMTPFLLMVNQEEEHEVNLEKNVKLSQLIVKPYTANMIYEKISRLVSGVGRKQ